LNVVASCPVVYFALLALAVCPLGLTACSGAAGTDIGANPAASTRDATAPPEVPAAIDATSPVPDVATSDDDRDAVADSNAPREASVSVDSGAAPEGGDETGGSDSGGPSLCSMICMGCCDTMGKCRTNNTTAICGANGASCEDCSTRKCPLTEAPCCGTKGCGCAVAGILGCN
jgi:hypothetical protein